MKTILRSNVALAVLLLSLRALDANPTDAIALVGLACSVVYMFYLTNRNEDKV
jgi:hypothetical protein